MKNRVVITGLGVVAPNGVGVSEFTEALKNGKSGITFHQELKDLNFSCQIGGIPNISEDLKSKSKNTAIEGRNLQGKVLMTFLNGELVFS